LNDWEGRTGFYRPICGLFVPIAHAGNWNVEFFASPAECTVGYSILLRDFLHSVCPHLFEKFLAIIAGQEARGDLCGLLRDRDRSRLRCPAGSGALL
jgi:hypothetical protein